MEVEDFGDISESASFNTKSLLLFIKEQKTSIDFNQLGIEWNRLLYLLAIEIDKHDLVLVITDQLSVFKTIKIAKVHIWKLEGVKDGSSRRISHPKDPIRPAGIDQVGRAKSGSLASFLFLGANLERGVSEDVQHKILFKGGNQQEGTVFLDSDDFVMGLEDAALEVDGSLFKSALWRLERLGFRESDWGRRGSGSLHSLDW